MSALFAPVLGALALSTAPAEPEIVILGARRHAAPVAAQTLDAEALERRGATTLDDVVVALPGVHMINDQDPGTNIVSIRGITTDRLQQAAIAYVLDGVALGDTELFTAPLYDLERVEALRGPQGARFGRNASGGAIAIRSRQDGPGRLRLGVGDGALREAEAAVGGEAWRLAGLWRAADGWIENRTLGRTVDAEEVRAARLHARTQAGAWTLRGKLEGFYEDGGAAWASSGDVTGDFGGELEGAALTDPIGDFEGRASRRWLQASAAAEGPAAGGSMALLIARDEYRKTFIEELDYRPGPLTFFGAPLFPAGLQPIEQPVDLEIWTGEGRWRGAIGPAELTLSLFRQTIDRVRVDDFGPLLFGAAPPRFVTESALSAASAGLALPLTAALRLEAQARFDRDERSQAISDARTGALIERREATFTRAQPRLALAWTRDPDLTLYAVYAEAFRTGGFNPPPTPGAPWEAAFAPEIARSGELGLKWRSRGARLEAAAFVTDVADYQNYTFLEGRSVTLSVDAVTIRGLELFAAMEGEAGPWAWTLDAGWALAEAEIDRYVAPDPLILGATRDYSGRRVPNAPAWTGTASAAISRGPVTGALALNATGETFYEIDNALRSPPKAWLDARLAFAAGDWTLAFWAKNLTDERWAISAFGQGMLPLLQGLGPGGPFDTFTLNRGRRFGVEFVREF